MRINRVFDNSNTRGQVRFKYALGRFMTAQFLLLWFTGTIHGKISGSQPDNKKRTLFLNKYFNLQMLWLKYIILYIIHIAQFPNLERKFKQEKSITKYTIPFLRLIKPLSTKFDRNGTEVVPTIFFYHSSLIK